MTIATVMTTANRAPKRNYVQGTVRRCLNAGLSPIVFATDPDVRWLRQLFPLEEIDIRIPPRRLTRIENGAAALLGVPDCDWVLHLEDDVQPCADAGGSVDRWLTRYAREDRRLVLFWSHDAYPSVGMGDHSIVRRFGAVALAMRRADAIACGTWCLAHASTWRSGTARLRGFDKMIAAWHRDAYPEVPAVSVSLPSLFQHLGRESSLSHLAPSGAFEISPHFTGAAWP